MTTGLPAHVVHFVQNHITSIEEMELLCLLLTRPDASWSIDDLTRELGSTVDSIARRLVGFARLGIVAPFEQRAVSVRCAEHPPDFRALLQEVAQCYRRRRIAMTTLIYERPDHPIRSFADAFRLRKDEPR